MKISFDLMDGAQARAIRNAIDAVYPPKAQVAPVAAPVAGFVSQRAPVAEPAPIPDATPTPTQMTMPLAEPLPVMSAAAGVEVDVNGTPWLAEVHATTKTFIKSGAWKSKRGVDAEVVAKAEAAARGDIASMPIAEVPMTPVVPMTEVPTNPVSMADVSQAWTDCYNNGLVTDADAMTIYGQLEIVPTELAVNESFRRKFVDHLNALMAPSA